MQALYEKIAVTSAESFRCTEIQSPRFGASWHFHPEIELTLIVSSRGLRFVGDRVARFSEGDLVLAGENLPHCWINDSGKRRGVAHAVVVQFRREFLGAPFLAAPELSPIAGLLDRSARGIQFHGGVRRRIAEEMRRLPQRHATDRLFALLGILRQLAESREARVLSSAGFRPELNEIDASRVDRIYHYILDRVQETIRLDDVARVAHLTPPAFCRYFKRASGKTLTRFVNEIRIGNACKMLVEGERSVAEACYASGYNNLTHFNRQFLRLTGMTPRDYKHRFGQAARNA